ncbi:RNA-guided endonuclease InsQ/TnpB family protein [Nostoc sp.]|uniref:RNA-guided endonuclease InsQ/TnpB family protein n=1 Tax=Nostoc sp. TaxID=1180 RepID=UPI002FF82203
MISQTGKKMGKEKYLMGVQQLLLHLDKDTKAILQYLCEQSGKLYNSGVYFARQILFKTGKLLTGKFDLIYEPSISKTTLSSSLPSIPAQQTLMSVTEAFKSFKELKVKFNKGNLHFQPRPPQYLKGSKLFKVAYPNTGLGRPILEGDRIKFPLGNTVNRWFNLKSFSLPLPSNIDYSRVKEFTVLPKNGAFYLEISYLVDKPKHELDINQALSIDLGTSQNLAVGVDTLGNSFLIDAKFLKSANQLWNKKVATRQENQPQGYWDKWLDRVTRKRHHQMRDGINKTAKLIIDHCIKHGIGTLVIGWNEGFKSNSNLGNLNNQKFVQMPLGKLRDRLCQLCELHGIRFEITEEAYTSQASFLDGDSLPKYGEKPLGWKASGKRVKRGLYQSADGLVVNADLNGAANILRKVAGRLGILLDQLSRRSMAVVARVRLN